MSETWLINDYRFQGENRDNWNGFFASWFSHFLADYVLTSKPDEWQYLYSTFIRLWCQFENIEFSTLSLAQKHPLVKVSDHFFHGWRPL